MISVDDFYLTSWAVTIFLLHYCMCQSATTFGKEWWLQIREFVECKHAWSDLSRGLCNWQSSNKWQNHPKITSTKITYAVLDYSNIKIEFLIKTLQTDKKKKHVLWLFRDVTEKIISHSSDVSAMTDYTNIIDEDKDEPCYIERILINLFIFTLWVIFQHRVTYFCSNKQISYFERELFTSATAWSAYLLK